MPLSSKKRLPVSMDLLGRVIDGVGEPLDGKGPIKPAEGYKLNGKPLNPLARRAITEPLDVGVRSINSFLTVGMGQRMGLFAGSGVGKSVLLGMMTRGTTADVIVVGLVGERGDVLVAERCLTGLATLDRPAGAALAEGLIARADAIEVPIARELVRWPTAAARDAELATLGLGPVVDTPSPHGEVLVDRLAAHGRAWRLHPSMYQEVHLQHLLESLSIEGVVVDSLHPTDASPRSWTALYVHHGGDRWRALLDGWTIDAEQLVGIANAVADRTDAAERLLLVEHVDGPRVLMGTEAALDTLVEAQLVYTPAPRERWSKQVEPSQDTGLSGTLMELLEAE